MSIAGGMQTRSEVDRNEIYFVEKNKREFLFILKNPYLKTSCVMPQQGLEIIPNFGVTIEIGHGIEHSGLDGLATVAEEPHDCTP